MASPCNIFFILHAQGRRENRMSFNIIGVVWVKWVLVLFHVASLATHKRRAPPLENFSRL